MRRHVHAVNARRRADLLLQPAPGFSLFALLDDACHAPGRQRLRAWMMRPSRDMDVLHARHEAIEVLMQPLNIDTLKQVRLKLRRVANIERSVPAGSRVNPSVNVLTTSFSRTMRRLLKRILQAKSTEMTWVRLIESLSTAIEIAHLRTFDHQSPVT